PVGRAGDEDGAIPVCEPRLLGRGQRLVAPWPGGHQSVAQGGAGPHAGACQLAQPGGDLLLDHPEEGADAERLRQLGGSRTAAEVVRGTDEPRAPGVRLEIQPGRAANAYDEAGVEASAPVFGFDQLIGQIDGRASGSTLQPIVKWTT